MNGDEEGVLFFDRETLMVVMRCWHCESDNLYIEGFSGTGCARELGTLDVWLKLMCHDCDQASSLSLCSCAGSVVLDWEDRMKERVRRDRDRRRGNGNGNGGGP